MRKKGEITMNFTKGNRHQMSDDRLQPGRGKEYNHPHLSPLPSRARK